MLNRPVQSQRSRVGPGAVQAFRPFFLAFDTQMENSNGPARSREQDVDLWLSDRVHEQLLTAQRLWPGFPVRRPWRMRPSPERYPADGLARPLGEEARPLPQTGIRGSFGRREVFDTRSEFGSSEFGVVVVRLFFDDDKEKLGPARPGV